MYCPECGGANDDTAKFCSTCGLDLERRREQWRTPGAGATGQAQPSYQQPIYRQPPYQQAPYQQPPYQPTYPQKYAPVYQPPYRVAGGYTAIPRISSYMGWAIALLICCFFFGGLWPTGIVAVVYASQVGNKLAIGDYLGAQHSSGRAKLWCWITFGVSIGLWIIGIIIWTFFVFGTGTGGGVTF